MTSVSPPRNRRGFEIAFICALSFEASCVQAVFDKFWKDYGKAPGDPNAYTAGLIDKHNVILAHMPGLGGNNAAGVAVGLRTSFPNIKLALVVGICGGVPYKSDQKEIVLGDIIISQALVQYDFGRQHPQAFETKETIRDSLGKLAPEYRAIQAKMETYHSQYRMQCSITGILKDIQLILPEAKHPGPENDILYPSNYVHKHHNATACDKCNTNDPQICKDAVEKDCRELGCGTRMLLERSRLASASVPQPMVHFGIMGSGNAVMRSGQHRDQIAKAYNIIAFEMEGAGVWEYSPSVVIKGVCDYADSHKGKVWQWYAAATAAACAKAFLVEWNPDDSTANSYELTETIRTERSLEIMEWLSSVNFWGKQNTLLQRAQPGSGSWILEEPKFKSWLTGERKLLLCSGESGAGKTTLSAIIIQHLSELKTEGDALAWIYADYREHAQQTMESLFTNVLVQLFQQRGQIPIAMIQSLGTNWHKAKPTLAEYRSWLRNEIKEFNRTIVVVDALDELRTKELGLRFIEELQQLGQGVQILVTYRPLPDVRDFRAVPDIEIHPRKEDVLLYIRTRLQNSLTLRDHVEAKPALSDLITQKLTEAKDRMFLKAELILNLFEHISSTEEVETTLRTLPPGYDDCYESSLKQIDRQESSRRKKAFQILAFLAYSLLPISVEALQHALSVKPGDVELDERNDISLDEILSICQGLVVVQTVENTQTVGLLHGTANRYLKSLRSTNFPNGHEIILRSCLAYLSLSCFSTLCTNQSRIIKRSKEYPFFSYAAEKWSEHAILGNLEIKSKKPIIAYLEKVQRHSADEFMGRRRPSAWSCEHGSIWTDWNRDSNHRRDTPLHAAAAYGLKTTVRFLLQEKGYRKEVLNNFNETALHRAAQLGQVATMDELLSHGANVEATVKHHYLNDADSLMLATICHQCDTVRTMVNHGISVNKFDPQHRFSPLHLAASMWTDMTQLLLDYGADVNFAGRSPLFPEGWPMTSLHFAVFNADKSNGALDRLHLLLDRGANINAQSNTGNTPLHIAMLGEHEELVLALLRRGADFEIRNKEGRTVLQIAREKGSFRRNQDGVPQTMLERLKDIPDLHRAAWSQDNHKIDDLLRTGTDIEEKDSEGSPVWAYCIRSGNLELARILIIHMKNHPLEDKIGYEAFQLALRSMTTFDYTDQNTWRSALNICQLLLDYARKFDPNFEFATERSPICGYQKTYLIWSVWEQRTLQAKFFLDCGADINAADAFKDTAVHHAVLREDINLVELLVTNGCDLQLRNQHGRTPLDSARDSEDVSIMQYLEKAEAGQ